MTDQRSVLFVCTGNICRSPAGEGVLLHLLHERGLAREIEVESAGVDDYHIGEPADSRMRRAAAHRGYALDTPARQVAPEDLEHFDLIVAMDRGHLRRLQALAGGPRESIRLFSDFLSDGQPVDIPDPYYGGAQGFEEVLDLMEAGCPALLDHLLSQP